MVQITAMVADLPRMQLSTSFRYQSFEYLCKIGENTDYRALVQNHTTGTGVVVGGTVILSKR